MKDFVKQVVPEALMLRARAKLVARNRRRIAKKAAREEVLFLQPVNRVEHYYHFLFDLTLPLHCLLCDPSVKSKIVVPEFGIFSDRIPQVFGPIVEVLAREEFPIDRALPLLGMNSQFTRLQPDEILTLKSRVIDALEIRPVDEPHKVLLIERMPPNEYFTNKAVKRGAGASRRSIPNHEEVRDLVASLVPEPFQFHNARLEELSFRQQVELFDSAAVVIAQHGAGLANCIWMHPKQHVIEITHRPDFKHFQSVSALLGHRHTLHVTEASHVEIDAHEFQRFLQRGMSSVLPGRM